MWKMIEYFPDPYPDEILYSVWARYSERVQLPDRYIAQELFGFRKKSVIDLPCRLGFFFDHLPTGHKYKIDDFVDGHTLFPYYSSFLSKERRDILRTRMITERGQEVHNLAGIIGNSIPRPMFLRYCPLCLEKDKELFGESYWHRLHQVPGVEVCFVHEIFLENSPFSVVGPSRNLNRYISAERITIPLTPRKASASPYFHILFNIAKDSDYLLQNTYISWENNMLVERYTSLLSSSQFLTKAGLIGRTPSSGGRKSC